MKNKENIAKGIDIEFFDFFSENLFGGIGLTEEDSNEAMPETTTAEPVSDDTDEETGAEAYLKKGEKILSLAKKAFAKLGGTVYGKIEEKLLNAKLLKSHRWGYAGISAIVETAASVVKPLFRELKFIDGELDLTCDAYHKLQGLMPKGLKLELSRYHVYRADMGKEDRYLEATIEDEDNELLYHATGKQLGGLDLHRDGSRHWRRDGLNIVSLHRWVGIMLCIKMVEERLETIKALSLDEQENSAEYNALMSLYSKKTAAANPYACIFEEGYRPHEKGKEPRPVEEIIYSSSGRMGSSVIKGIIEDILNKFNCPLELKLVKSGDIGCLQITHETIVYLTTYWLKWFLDETSSGVDYSFKAYHKLLAASTKDYLSNSLVLLPVMKVLETMRNRYAAEKRQRQLMRELSGDYAKSYQTKKNIPQKTVRAMKDSEFNKYFSYVEFDEEVDLGLVKELFKEFKAVMTTFLNGVSCSGNAIRFRKLGNHKASGLYYPQVKCLCVDMRIPSSFIHELGHLIDYCRGELSLKSSFDEVRRLYENRLREAAKEEGNEVLNGKTKYNLDYYLTPTEIFARCFETYLCLIKGVDNSICPKSGVSGFAYPFDDEMLGAIKSFYDSLDLNGTGELPFEITGATIPTVAEARALKDELRLVNGARCASWWAQNPDMDDALITCAKVGNYGVMDVIPWSGHRYYIRPLLTFRSTERVEVGATFKVNRYSFTVISPGRAIAMRSIGTSRYAEPYKRYGESIVKLFVDEWYKYDIEDKKTGAIFTSCVPSETGVAIKAADA